MSVENQLAELLDEVRLLRNAVVNFTAALARSNADRPTHDNFGRPIMREQLVRSYDDAGYLRGRLPDTGL